jgi:hydrogenase maturation protein HypF
MVGAPGTERTTYEGQAAVELELAADGPESRGYPFRLRPENEGWIVETREIIRGVVDDLLAGTKTGEISSRFHRTIAEVVVAGCERIREVGETAAVALSGGTFQNMLLLEQLVRLLEEKGFAVYRHRRVPPNDGGIALGQAILADRTFRNGLTS